MTVRACSEGYELFTPMGYDGSSYTKTCYWAMPAVFALETDAASHESFLDAFEVFCYFTSVSREYEIMREKNAEELVEAVVRARNDQPGYSEDEQQRRFDEIEESTVGSGDTYSVNEGWTDYIRDQTDYRTSDGTHVKIPSSYDHVFEGDDGNIYVGSSVDGPAGSTELTPTQIGY